MSLLITGGIGFVLSNLARLWLETDARTSVVLLDSAEWDSAAESFFAPVRDRLTFVRGDVRDPFVWQWLAAEHRITHVVHGAAVTPSPELERECPSRILEVNIDGTIRALEAVRMLPGLQRFVFVSSGAVYGDATESVARDPVVEDGSTRPVDLYGVSKQACEGMARRYQQLFGWDIISVRLSSVFGPMERPNASRFRLSAPYQLGQLILRRQPIRTNSLEAGGDWIHAGDVARALVGLLRAGRLRYQVYNVASGQFTTIRELIEGLRLDVPDLDVAVVSETEANLYCDPSHRGGRWGAYSISRVAEELGWKPTPIQCALRAYLVWLRENPVP